MIRRAQMQCPHCASGYLVVFEVRQDRVMPHSCPFCQFGGVDVARVEDTVSDGEPIIVVPERMQ